MWYFYILHFFNNVLVSISLLHILMKYYMQRKKKLKIVIWISFDNLRIYFTIVILIFTVRILEYYGTNNQNKCLK